MLNLHIILNCMNEYSLQLLSACAFYLRGERSEPYCLWGKKTFMFFAPTPLVRAEVEKAEPFASGGKNETKCQVCYAYLIFAFIFPAV